MAPTLLQVESSSSPRKSELRDKIRVLVSLVVNPFPHLTLLCMLVGLLLSLLPSIFNLELACHIGCIHLVAYLVNSFIRFALKRQERLKFVVSYSPPSSRPYRSFHLVSEPRALI